MDNKLPFWCGLFRKNYIDNYIRLVIRAYQNIPRESRNVIKKEEERRTELVEIMRSYKHEFHITFPISYESGEKGKRMDICCYLDNMNEDSYICFECKRFLNGNITKSHFKSEYYEQGIKRFEENEYSRYMPQAGMIAFLESGDMKKLKHLIETELPQNSFDKKLEDCSLQYMFSYIYRSSHKRKENDCMLALHHILLDLTK